MAVVGFGRNDLEVAQEQNRLTIRARRQSSGGKIYLHRGIATHAFQHHFDLADHVKVTDGTMGEGLLVISLRRELPEELKPRTIPINAGKFFQLNAAKREGGEAASQEAA